MVGRCIVPEQSCKTKRVYVRDDPSIAFVTIVMDGEIGSTYLRNPG